MPSTAIRAMRYDAESRILSVWFVPSGHRYDYFDVPQETFLAFKSSTAKGRFFNTHIRGGFDYRQVAEAEAEALEPISATIAKL